MHKPTNSDSSSLSQKRRDWFAKLRRGGRKAQFGEGLQKRIRLMICGWLLDDYFGDF
jgi:hypothetical protein